MISRLTCCLVLLAALGACGGSMEGRDDAGPRPDGDVATGTARELFDSTCLAIFQNRCSACHTGTGVSPPKFLGDSGPTGFYDAITASPYVSFTDPASSTVVNKGSHSGGAAPALTADEKAKVIAWLTKEGEER
jgi:mono/diheme cytochrome c family protein